MPPIRSTGLASTRILGRLKPRYRHFGEVTSRTRQHEPYNRGRLEG
jgi:hypothetical protein